MHVRVVDSSCKAMPGAKVHASLWTKEPVKANRDYLCERREKPRSNCLSRRTSCDLGPR